MKTAGKRGYLPWRAGPLPNFNSASDHRGPETGPNEEIHFQQIMRYSPLYKAAKTSVNPSLIRP